MGRLFLDVISIAENFDESATTKFLQLLSDFGSDIEILRIRRLQRAFKHV